jgi:hypothetical protein
MPWTPSEFKSRHAKNLTSDQADRASSIANAMLKHGADEGMAIATGIKRAKEMAAQLNVISMLASSGKLSPAEEKELHQAKLDASYLRDIARRSPKNRAHWEAEAEEIETTVRRLTAKQNGVMWVSSIRVDALHHMLKMEAAAAGWFERMTKTEQKAYVKAHPRSKYAKTGSKTAIKPKAPRGANPILHDHLIKTGWEFNGDHYAHPTSKRKISFRPASLARHHMVITHANGDVTERKTASDARAKRIVSRLAKKPKSNIAEVLKQGKGGLHEHFGLDRKTKIPLSKLAKLAKSDHPLARRAQMVLNLQKARKRGPVEYEAAK